MREAYAAHGAELYRYALRGLGDAATAQDAVQETFLRAWRARDRYDPQIASLRVWLFSIARNVVIDLHRAHGVRPWLRSLADHQTLAEVPVAGPDEWEGLMHRWLVEEGLRRLGEDHRRALEQHTSPTDPTKKSRSSSGSPLALCAAGSSTDSRPCAS